MPLVVAVVVALLRSGLFDNSILATASVLAPHSLIFILLRYSVYGIMDKSGW